MLYTVIVLVYYFHHVYRHFGCGVYRVSQLAQLSPQHGRMLDLGYITEQDSLHVSVHVYKVHSFLCFSVPFYTLNINGRDICLVRTQDR